LSTLCKLDLSRTHRPADSQRTFANLEEDVETEDAWEMASRRASVLSRKASNHSLRVPAPETIPSPSAAMEEVPTAVHHDDIDLEHVLYQSHPNGNDIDADADGEMAASDDLASLSLGESSEPTANELGLGLPISPNHTRNAPSTSFSQAATPMNETFLSTLAPGMHQRLDQAEADSGSGSSSHGHGIDVPEVVEEEDDDDDDFVQMDGVSSRGRGNSTEGRDEMMSS
jgi:hypothetical protein